MNDQNPNLPCGYICIVAWERLTGWYNGEWMLNPNALYACSTMKPKNTCLFNVITLGGSGQSSTLDKGTIVYCWELGPTCVLGYTTCQRKDTLPGYLGWFWWKLSTRSGQNAFQGSLRREEELGSCWLKSLLMSHVSEPHQGLEVGCKISFSS